MCVFLFQRKYFRKFYALIDKLPKSNECRGNVCSVTSHLIAKLEEKYGRLQPTATRDDVVNDSIQRSIILQKIDSNVHFRYLLFLKLKKLAQDWANLVSSLISVIVYFQRMRRRCLFGRNVDDRIRSKPPAPVEKLYDFGFYFFFLRRIRNFRVVSRCRSFVYKLFGNVRQNL